MAFLPSDLASLLLHLDAGSITGKSDGDDVDSWTDQSTTGASLTAAIGHEAIYRSAAVNSLPAVEFDGSTSRLTTSTAYPSDVANLGLVAVTKLDTNKNYNGFFVFDSASPATDYLKISFWADSSGNAYFYTSAGYLTITGGLTAGWQIVTYVLGQNTMFNRYDGIAVTQATNPPPGTWADNLKPTIGHVGLSNSFLDGRIAELVVFEETVLSESLYVEGYLSDKYSISLQADHPFSASPPSAAPSLGGMMRSGMSGGFFG